MPIFDNKVALITGASGGLGLRVAEKLAASGAIVVINSRSEEKGEKAVAGLRKISDRVSFVIGDTMDYDATVKVASAAAAINGGIDVVVSSGAQGAVRPMPFADMTGAEVVSAFHSRFFARIFLFTPRCLICGCVAPPRSSCWSAPTRVVMRRPASR